ncbi:hypothetical protein BgiMline_005569, partial [Biomphalaria glabrata]
MCFQLIQVILFFIGVVKYSAPYEAYNLTNARDSTKEVTQSASETLASKEMTQSASETLVAIDVIRTDLVQQNATDSSESFPALNKPETATTLSKVSSTFSSGVKTNLSIKNLTTLTVVMTSPQHTYDIITASLMTPAAEVPPTFTMTSGKYTFTWDKTTVSPRVYQNSWCPRRCLNGNIVYINNLDKLCISPRCFPCECRRPACEIFGICCPDLTSPTYPPQHISVKVGLYSEEEVMTSKSLKHMPEIFQFFNKNFNKTSDQVSTYTVHKPTLGCDVKSSFMKFLYIRSCPPDYLGHEKTMCEIELELENITMSWYTRVIDSATGVAYKNIYCATCNGVNKPLEMSITIQCTTYMYVYNALDSTHFLKLALMDNSTCVVMQDFPTNISLLTCSEKFFPDNVISSCPNDDSTTDQDVKYSCEHLVETSNRVLISPAVYTNIFCSICATMRFPYINKCGMSGGSTGLTFRSPFDFILSSDEDITEESQSNVSLSPVCQSFEWSSPNGKCLQLFCSEGKLLGNTSCKTAISQITGLEYKIHILLLPKDTMDSEDMSGNETISTEELFHGVEAEVTIVFKDLIESAWLNIGLVMETKSRTNKIKFLWIDGTILSTKNISRDEFEIVTLERLSSFNTNNFSIVLNMKTIYGFIDGETYCNKMKSTFINLDCQIYQFSLVASSYVGVYQSSRIQLELNRILTCRYVKFDPSNYTLHIDEKFAPPLVTIVIDLEVIQLKSTSPDHFNMLFIDPESEGKLLVCKELLDTVRFSLSATRTTPIHMIIDDVTRAAKYYLSYVCFGISMLCLTLTILTYSLFSSLRTLAGQNNMCLSVTLLLAQILSIVNSAVSAPSPLCTALGLMFHFAWLWTFTWTFICSFRMFRVFTAKNRTVSSNGAVSLLKRVFLSIIFPSIVVTSVVISNYFVSSARTIGYGLYRCYLDTSFLI